MNGPLAGIRVVEMTHMVMGPSCGMFLTQFGAEVIKVEPPQGDKTRYLRGMGEGFFPVFNRGKKSIVLDLKSEAGKTALHQLLATADVFVENFRDSALEKIGLRCDEMRQTWPRLIIAAHKGFLSGPYEHRPALDEVVQMMTGLAYMTGPTGQPLRVGSSANDIMGGMQGAMSIMSALLEREKTGQGKMIRIGLFENCLLMVAQHMVQYELTGKEPPPMPERDFSWPVYDIFETADKQQMFISAVTGQQWQVFCEAFGLQDLLTDERLQDQMGRINARPWTIPRIRKQLIKYNADTLSEIMERLGLPYSPIKRPAELYDDPHVNRRGGLVTSVNADGRQFRTPAMPVEFDGQPLQGEVDIAPLGADTESILTELGYGGEELQTLLAVSQ